MPRGSPAVLCDPGDVPGLRIDEVTDLLQHLIRNGCVNDGRPGSGNEWRSAATIAAYLDGCGLDCQTYEPETGRVSLVARIDGWDPNAPSLCLLGHTDVVPANSSQWSQDPFGGDLINGEVWGRGAVDMLNLTASMAATIRCLALEGFRPRGHLVFGAVADEESGGRQGTEWLTRHLADEFCCDYVLTETGGVLHDGPAGRTVTIGVAEKGAAWRRLRVKGTPGHGSMPYGVDNAVAKAAEVIHRLTKFRPTPQIDDIWRGYVEAQGFGSELADSLLDPDRLEQSLGLLDPRSAKYAHACTHTTISPNVVHGGLAVNVIPDEVALDVDIRTLPGVTDLDVSRYLTAALGDLASDVDVEALPFSSESNRSPIETPLFETIERVTRLAYPGAKLLPRMLVGATDARFLRDVGAVAYGFSLYSESITYADLSTRFHGVDERVDVESLKLTAEALLRVCRDFLG